MTLCRSVAVALLLGARVLHALVCEPDLLDEVQNRCSNGNVQILRTASPQVRRCYPSLTCNVGVSVGDGSEDELHDTIDDLV